MTERQPVYTNKLIIELLHKLPPFSMFSENEIRKMLYSGKLVRIERFKADEVLIQEGTFGKWVYLLMKGAVRVTKGRATLCTMQGPGEIIGEIGAMEGKQRSATVTAMGDVVCIAVNISVIEHMSGEEREQYLQRMRGFFEPIMEERLQKTSEVTDILTQIKVKEEELSQLRNRLKELNVSEEKSILQLLLEGGE